MKNPYATLGVPNFSTYEVVKAAYIKLVKMYHPDRNPTTEAAAKMREVNEAYDSLKTSESKEKTDRKLQQGVGGGPSSFWGSPNQAFYGSFDEIFGSPRNAFYKTQAMQKMMKLAEEIAFLQQQIAIKSQEYNNLRRTYGL